MSNRKAKIYSILRLATGLVIISAIITHVWNDEFVGYWTNIDWRWLLVAGLAIFASTLLGLLNIFILLNIEEEVRFRKLVPAYWFAWAFGLIIPGQIGDLVALSAWLRKQGYEWHFGISRTVIDKIISLLVVLGYTVIGGLLLNVLGIQSAYLVSVALALLCVPVLTFMLGRKRIQHWLDGRKGIFFETASSALLFLERNPRTVLFNTLVSIVKFSLIGLSYWAVFRAIGIADIAVSSVVVLAAASSLIAYIPISFNGLGTVELAGIALFSQLGIPSEAVVSAYLSLRILVIFLAWLPVALWLSNPKKAGPATTIKN